MSLSTRRARLIACRNAGVRYAENGWVLPPGTLFFSYTVGLYRSVGRHKRRERSPSQGRQLPSLLAATRPGEADDATPPHRPLAHHLAPCIFRLGRP